MKLRVFIAMLGLGLSMVASAQSVIFKKLDRYTGSLSKENNSISTSRIEELNKLSEKIVAQGMASGKLTVVFVSENNSSVSQLSQAWFQMFVHKMGLKNIEVNSAGVSESTISKETISALKDAGFKINANTTFSSNKRYLLSYSWDSPQILMFSKKTDNYQIPTKNVITVNVDDSIMDASNALQTSKTIAIEMMYVAEKIKNYNLLSHNQ